VRVHSSSDSALRSVFDRTVILLTVLTLLICACSGTEPEASSPTPGEGGAAQILISEALAGIEGNNNLEFIELYNTSSEMQDLKGWSLWYRLASSVEDLPVHHFEEHAYIAPYGHYLMGRADEDLGVVVDAIFNQALNLSGGGLELRRPTGERADALGWGSSPALFTEGEPAAALKNGSSLERAPGGKLGNGEDSDRNAADFHLNPTPSPQNSGSPAAPVQKRRLSIHLNGPENIEPGSSLNYLLRVSNPTDEVLEDILVEIPVPEGLEVETLPDGTEFEDGRILWAVSSLGAAEERSLPLRMTVPWKYTTIIANNVIAEVRSQQIASIAEPLWTRIEHGSLPVRAARLLIGEQVIVEGQAVMYTGGFFAGSSGVKFYLEDDTGGVQVYVPSGAGQVEIPLGALVRVSGSVELYRGAVEIVPDTPDSVRILEEPPTEPFLQPDLVSIRQALFSEDTLLGKLIQVEGTATRIEEFTYSFEVDLADDEGQVLTLYIDKLTGISVEPLSVGNDYNAAGVLEIRDGFINLYPRIQQDLVEVFPPELIIEAEAPSGVAPGEVFTVTLTAFNYSEQRLTGLRFVSPTPDEGFEVDAIMDGGTRVENQLVWTVPALTHSGGAVSVRYLIRAGAKGTQYINEGYRVTANEWPQAVSGAPLRVFIGSGVPIWAIQGSEFTSPYKLDRVRTRGVVTGVFREMDGFWIQELESDDDPNSSAGLFVSVGDLEVVVQPGDQVEVGGQVREISQQTLLQVDALEDVRLLARGQSLPAPTPLDPPTNEDASHRYYEALEGMLVEVAGPALAVGPTTRYGEYALVLPYRDIERLFRGDPMGMLITVDDGSGEVHQDRSTLDYVVATGDQVSGVLGPLAFTYGRYKVEPIQAAHVDHAPSGAPSLPALAPDEFSIMSWNVENLFDILDPHPNDPPRPRKSDYDLALTKIANTIINAGVPTVIGLQEVEHIGILEDLAEHDLLTGYRYTPFLLEGGDSRGLDVGYLVRSDQASIERIEQYNAPEGITSRPPLFLQIELDGAQDQLALCVINNHFTSLAEGEAVTEPRRIAQAEWSLDVLKANVTNITTSYAALIGDLNSFYESPPLDVLRSAGLRHVFEVLNEEERYTYNFQGVSQAIDHILVTPALMERLMRVQILHVNADYPPMEPGDPSPFSESDHDPVVAVFSLSP
jgi:hypothetical protein